MHTVSRTVTSVEGTTRNVAQSADHFVAQMQRAVDAGNISAAIESYDLSVDTYRANLAQAKLIGATPDQIYRHYAPSMFAAASIINTALDNKYPTAPTANRRANTWRRYNY